MEIMHLNLWEPRGDHYHHRLAINFDVTCFVIFKVTDRDSSEEATNICSEESSFTEKTTEVVQAGTYQTIYGQVVCLVELRRSSKN